MTQTYKDWPDLNIKEEGLHLPIEYRPRKRKHIREGSILWYLRCILMAAFTVMLFWYWYVMIWVLMG